MKHPLFIFLMLLTIVKLNGQVPQGFAFQTIIRDSEGKVLKNQTVGLQFSILEGGETGPSAYTERHTAISNAYGVINVTIGQGTLVSGTYDEINWGGTLHYLKTDIDLDGGVNYSISKTAQLVSVPYSEYSKKASVADTVLKVPDDSPANEIQKFRVSDFNDTLFVSDGNFVIIPGLSNDNVIYGDINWERTFGGTESEYGTSIVTSSDSGYIILGTTKSGDGDITDDNNGNEDIWVIKIDSNGNKLWDKTFGGAGNDVGNSLVNSSDGGYVILGFTNSNDVDITDGNNGSADIWVIKIDSNGNKLWDKTFGGAGNDVGNSLVNSSDGGYVILGNTKSNDGDVTDIYFGSEDIWVIKIDSNGNKLWDKTFGGTRYDIGKSISHCSDGGFIIVGYTQSEDGNINGSIFGIYDILVIKINSNGNKIWHKKLSDGNGNSVKETYDQNYLVVGSGGSNGWIIYKLDNNGNELWKKYFDNGYEAISVLPLLTGDFIVAGVNGSSGLLSRNFLVVRFNESGEKLWDNSYGGSDSDIFYSIVNSLDNGYVLVGSTASNDGDVKDGNYGLGDLWILKINNFYSYSKSDH